MLSYNIFDFRIKTFKSILDNAFFSLSKLQKYILLTEKSSIRHLVIRKINSIDGAMVYDSAPTVYIGTLVIENRALEASDNVFIVLFDNCVHFSLLQPVDQKIKIVHQKESLQRWIFEVPRSQF